MRGNVATTKLYFEDLSERTQQAIRKQIEEELLSNRKSELQAENRSQDAIDEELDIYKYSEALVEDVSHYINCNNIGETYTI